MRHFCSGWTPSKPDFRDRVFRSPLRGDPLPSMVDLSQPALGSPFEPVWDQGNIGSCGSFTACADAVFAALRQEGGASCPLPSRLFVYYVTRLVMGPQYVSQDSGVDNRSLVKALAKYGWCDDSLWPYDVRKFAQQPPRECFEQAASRRISEYLAVPQSFDGMKECLAGGDPFIFGFTVYDSLMSPEVSRTGVIPLPTRRDRQKGGHDVLVVGYDNVKQAFKLRNSWSKAWGEDGYGWIPYAYATDPRLASDFWTVRRSGLPSSPPAPPPSPPGDVATVILLDAAGKEIERFGK